MRLLSCRPSAIVLTTVLAAGAIAFSERSSAHSYGSARVVDMATAASNSGGLSVSPGIFEQSVRRGTLGMVQVSNTTAGAMAVTVVLRPWLQAHSGEVSPNRRASLGEVGVSSRSFTLDAGAARAVRIFLSRIPAQRSLYGAIEVTGLPSGRARRGITVGYRVVSSLRLDPPKSAQTFRAQVGGLIEQGSTRHGTLLLVVRNTGNTIVPIGGTALISGPGRSLRAEMGGKSIVPGQTVNVPLTELSGSLPKGRYTVTVHLSQGGHGVGTVRRTIALR